MSATPDPNCPTCHGAGWLVDRSLVARSTLAPLVRCGCLNRAQATERLTALAGRYGRQTFDAFDATLPGLGDAYGAATAYAAQPAPTGWLILAGAVGCGKTHLALSIAHAVIERGVAALFVTAPDLLDQLRATIGDETGESMRAILGRYQAAPLLILDDLGTEKPSPFTHEKLFALLNDRYQRGAATVITTNLDLDKAPAETHLGARLVSRLRDEALIERIDMAGAADYRRRSAAQRKGARHAA